MGKTYFRTNAGKGAWKGKERNGQVEERFVREALFSRLLAPFGTTAHSHIIAPFSADGHSLAVLNSLGENSIDFRLYWDSANRAWREHSGSRPPLTLVDQIDYQGKLSSQLNHPTDKKVVYKRSGSYLEACVVSSQTIADGTLNWFASADQNELHYLAAIFNSPCLQEFFKNGCRYSDRHFQMLPVQNLPIPGYAAADERHADLAAASVSAHQRVAALLAERQSRSLRTTRKNVLSDDAVKSILSRIDRSVRQILPAYCS